MRILIIEDEIAKEDAVRRHIVSVISSDKIDGIDSASNLSEAMRIINTQRYDLIVLDIMLPFIEGTVAATGAGLELLSQIRTSSSPNRGTTVVGLSAYPDELQEARIEFEKHGVLVLQYDSGGNWCTSLARVIVDVLARSLKVIVAKFVIVVALEEELAGYLSCDLNWGDREVIGGLNSQFVSVTDRPGDIGVIIRLRQMGLAAAINDTVLAVSIFKPDIVCMSGICAGFKKNATLGQLIVASPSWEYQSGKWSDNGFELAAYQIPLRASTRALVDQSLGKAKLIDALEKDLDGANARPALRATPKLAPAATGSAVIADAARLKHVEVQHRKIAALDMETFGVYFACHESYHFVQHYFSIKCVVDLADDHKDDSLHTYGCITSARATVHALRALLEAS